MENLSIQTDIFKFVALRPPVSPDQKNAEINYISDDRVAEETPPGKVIKRIDPQDGTLIPEKIKDLIQQFNYTLDFPSEGRIKKIGDFVRDIDKNTISTEKLNTEIKQLLNEDIESFYSGEEGSNQRHDIWDRYYSFFVLGRTEPQNLETLTESLRLYHLLDLLIKNLPVPNSEALNNIMAAKPLIPKLFSDLPKPKPAEPPVVTPPDEQTVMKYKGLWKNLIDTQRAIDETKNVKFENKINTETRNTVIPNKTTGIQESSKLTLFTNRLVVNKQSFQSMHVETKKLLSQSNISVDNLQLTDALTQLQLKQQKAVIELNNVKDSNIMEYKPDEISFFPGLSTIVSNLISGFHLPPIFIPPPTNVRASIKPLGIGDLKVVKQKLLKYVEGEVAHIENVLRGETKERRYRVLDRTEETLVQSTETEEETTKDTQTTERFELKKESEKTVQEQMSVQAGVTISGSYGMVTFGAHGDFAYSTASAESNKNSSNFAREVIDKSVSRIQKKTKEERTTKQLHEVEEIDIHGLDNKGQPDNISGIYRWVDKHYEAQIFNYGKRMMFEFIIPEPAAFYEYALNNVPKKDIVAPTPFTETHQSINDLNYATYIAAYNVQGVVPPPMPFKTVSTALTKEGMELDGKAHTNTTKELVVPAGYASKVGVWFDCSAYFNNHPRLEITIGNKIFRLLDNKDGVGAVNTNAGSSEPYHTFYEGSPIEICINSYDIISYTLNAYIFVERTPEAYELWQLQTFEKIMSAYTAMKAEYEQKIAAQQTQTGIAITGQNPGINREIEKTELRKYCIKMLMDTFQFGYFDAMKQPLGKAPDFDIFDAVSEGKTIQFFEQAFEWENLTYLFYPYFWGRNEQWIHKINTYDNDPLFTKFLQAGSSRVVLPVHPGYNDAVMYFLENNGSIWNGGETPRLNDPLFISLADELREQTDDLSGAKPDGDPWQVILPTTLVYLQKDAVLPDFTLNP